VADLVALRSDALTASIDPLGAELWSLRDAEGRELMTDADPAFWSGRCSSRSSARWRGMHTGWASGVSRCRGTALPGGRNLR
jgi:hypothetical protein